MKSLVQLRYLCKDNKKTSKEALEEMAEHPKKIAEKTKQYADKKAAEIATVALNEIKNVADSTKKQAEDVIKMYREKLRQHMQKGNPEPETARTSTDVRGKKSVSYAKSKSSVSSVSKGKKSMQSSIIEAKKEAAAAAAAAENAMRKSMETARKETSKALAQAQRSTKEALKDVKKNVVAAEGVTKDKNPKKK